MLEYIIFCSRDRWWFILHKSTSPSVMRGYLVVAPFESVLCNVGLSGLFITSLFLPIWRTCCWTSGSISEDTLMSTSFISQQSLIIMNISFAVSNRGLRRLSAVVCGVGVVVDTQVVQMWSLEDLSYLGQRFCLSTAACIIQVIVQLHVVLNLCCCMYFRITMSKKDRHALCLLVVEWNWWN